jgi:hypothetical protein
MKTTSIFSQKTTTGKQIWRKMTRQLWWQKRGSQLERKQERPTGWTSSRQSGGRQTSRQGDKKPSEQGKRKRARQNGRKADIGGRCREDQVRVEVSVEEETLGQVSSQKKTFSKEKEY